MDVKDFDRTHAVNERGVWLCCKYALKQMMAQEPREANARGEKTRGWIVNAASMLGLIGLAHGNSYVPGTLTSIRIRPWADRLTLLSQSIAKHAVVGMTKQMAIDYAKDRIHINCLCPGFVESPMIAALTSEAQAKEGLAAAHPWNALGTPEDVAGAALFLCSDES